MNIKEKFVPVNEGKVGIYTCGPTVYNYAHIGNLRTYIFEDILKKAFEYGHYKVKHIMNITDVGHLQSDADTGEDKMQIGAERENKTVWEIAKFYENAFFKDCQKLNIRKPDIVCKATDHIQDMIDIIKTLEEKGYTYTSNGNVYYEIDKFKDYNDTYIMEGNAYLYSKFKDAMEISIYEMQPYVSFFKSKLNNNFFINIMNKIPLEWEKNKNELLSLAEYLTYRLDNIEKYISIIVSYNY